MIEEQLWLSEIKGSGNKSRAIVQCFLFWSEQKKKDKILRILPASMASMAGLAFNAIDNEMYKHNLKPEVQFLVKTTHKNMFSCPDSV